MTLVAGLAPVDCSRETDFVQDKTFVITGKDFFFLKVVGELSLESILGGYLRQIA